MAEIDFSDLIPAKKPAPVVDFSDLIPAKPAEPVDPIRAQVRKELDAEKVAGMVQDGIGRQFLQGATFGAADEILAGLMTPVQMLKRGVGPGEAWRYAKAKEDMRLEDARAAGGVAGGIGEAAGGMGSGISLARAGLSVIPAATAKLGKIAGTAAGGLVDGAALGGVSGFLDGEDNRVEHAKHGAFVGGALGGALPLAVAAAKPVVAPVVSNVMARINPEAYAERQVARAATRSGQTPEQIGDRVSQAAIEGQPEYRLLDALDNPGARLASVVGRNPGEGRTELHKFLHGRQEDQAYRLGNAVSEGLDAPLTAKATKTRMEGARQAADDEAFGAVRADANPVDVGDAVRVIDETLRPGLTGQLGLQNNIAYDSVEGALSRARALLTDGRSQVVDFAVVQRARGDIADAVEKAMRAGEGNKARLLRQVRNALDQQLEEASPGFREAMSNSRASAREIDAIETGTTAAQRGRTEDKLATFGAMTPGEQAAFRTGYADPVIARIQGAAEGANKARPLTSQAMQTELPAFAAEGRGDTLMRQVRRENEMFANRAEATGGSKTADNLADNADVGFDPGIIGKLFSLNFAGATKDAILRGAAALNGNTEAVRAQMAKLLMEGNRDKIVTMLIRLGQADARGGQLGSEAFRGLLAGGVPAFNAAISRPETANRR